MKQFIVSTKLMTDKKAEEVFIELLQCGFDIKEDKRKKQIKIKNVNYSYDLRTIQESINRIVL